MLTITPFLCPPNVRGGYSKPWEPCEGLWGATYPPLVTDQCGSDCPLLAGMLALGHARDAVEMLEVLDAPLFGEARQ